LKKYINEVREYYREEYSYNDPAHRIDHTDKVCSEALYIVEELNLNVNKRMVVVAAYVHDLKCHVNRTAHNTLGAKYVMEAKDDKILNEFSRHQRLVIAKAVLQHRSSYRGARGNILSNIIATADIGPLCVNEVIMRSFKYNSRLDISFEEKCKNVYDHLKDKFGSNGYRVYPEFYTEVYGPAINIFNALIDGIQLEDVVKVIKENT